MNRIVLAAFALVAFGCSGVEPADDAAVPEPISAAEGDPHVVPPDCILIEMEPTPKENDDPGIAGAIAASLDLSGPSTIRNVWAVRSLDHKRVHYVSGTIDAPGVSAPATWAVTGTLDSPGGYASVGGTDILSLFPSRPASYEITDAAAQRSLECVEMGNRYSPSASGAA